MAARLIWSAVAAAEALAAARAAAAAAAPPPPVGTAAAAAAAACALAMLCVSRWWCCTSTCSLPAFCAMWKSRRVRRPPLASTPPDAPVALPSSASADCATTTSASA